MPRAVIASFSSFKGGGYYFDYHDGSKNYQAFFMEEWLPFLRRTYKVNSSRENTWLTGTSMGGCGSLRLAFTFPQIFGGVVAMEPAIDPTFTPSELQQRHLQFRQELKGMDEAHAASGAQDTKQMLGAVAFQDWDEQTYQRFNPACVVRATRKTSSTPG